jgi:hypothetical protein
MTDLKVQADRLGRANTRRRERCIVRPKETVGDRRTRLLEQLDELLATVDGALVQTDH